MLIVLNAFFEEEDNNVTDHCHITGKKWRGAYSF